MKRAVSGVIAQKVIAVLLIIAMMASYFPVNSFAEVADQDDPNIGLSVAYEKNGESCESGVEGKTSDAFAVNYRIQLKNIQTGFKNVQLTVETDNVEGLLSEDSVTCTNESSTYQTDGFCQVNYGDRNRGEIIENTVAIKFGDMSTAIERTVTLTLRATYMMNGEEYNYVEKKVFKANLIPATKISEFNTYVDIYDEIGGKIVKYIVEKNTVDYEMNKYGRPVGYYTEDVTITYPLHVASLVYTQKLELKVTIDNRDGKNVNRMSDGFTIDWNGLDSKLGEPTRTDNDDGSITYTFTKGNDSEEFIKENTFSFSGKYNIKVNYITEHTNAKEESQATLRETMQHELRAEMNCTGFKTTEVYGQNKIIEKKSRKSIDISGSTERLCEYLPGEHAWIGFRVASGTIDGKIAQNENQTFYALTPSVIRDLIEKRTAKITTRLCYQYVGGDLKNQIKQIDTNTGEVTYYDDEDDVQTGVINMMEPVLKYLNDEGEIVTLSLNENQFKLKAVEAGEPYFQSSIEDLENSDFTKKYEVDEGMSLGSFGIELKDYLDDYVNYFIYGRNRDITEIQEKGSYKWRIRCDIYIKCR